MGVKDTAFRDLKKYKKYYDLFDITSIEVRASLGGAVIITLFIVFLLSKININDANELMKALTKDIAIALIGFLGFVVSGLAILTSAISTKVINIIKNKNKLQIIERILLSFYLLGLLIGILIVSLLFSYMLVFLELKINIITVFILTLILSYLIIFIIFYSIALIGNCVQIFNIINVADEYAIELDEIGGFTTEDKNLYNSFRITAMEIIVFTGGKLTDVERLQKYKEFIFKLIESECKNSEQKERIKRYAEKCFNNKD